MKKILVILLLQMAIAFNVFAQGEGDRIVNPTWKLSSGALSPTVSTWTLTLPATTFSPSIVTPLIIGGADTVSTLTYKTTTGVGKTGARHIFVVGTNGGTEAMTILNNGFVGIGIPNPTSSFEVVKNQNASTYLKVTNTDATNGESRARLSLTGGTVVQEMQSIAGDAGYFGTVSNHPFKIYINSGTRLTITTNGDLGLGTTTPLHKLSGYSTTATNLNAFNFINNTINKVTSTVAEAIDTSSFSLNFSSLGSPKLSLKGKTGNSMIYVDSVGVGIGIVAPAGKLDVNGTLVFGGVGSYVSGQAQIYQTAADGITIIGKTGSANDFVLAEGGGTTLFRNPVGTNNVIFPSNNVGIGVTTFPATLAKGLAIANGTAPTVKANSASLYVVLGEMYVYDSTGTATQISPHNEDGDWVFNSYNTETGERTYINMITLAEIVEVLSGKTLIVRDNVLQEVQEKDAYEEYDSTITISKKVTEDEATSLVIDTVYTEIADTTQLVEYYTYDDKTKKVEKKTKYKINKVSNYVSEWKIKDGYKFNETNGDFEKTTSTKKASRLKSNAKIKDGKYYIINLARQ